MTKFNSSRGFDSLVGIRITDLILFVGAVVLIDEHGEQYTIETDGEFQGTPVLRCKPPVNSTSNPGE